MSEIFPYRDIIKIYLEHSSVNCLSVRFRLLASLQRLAARHAILVRSKFIGFCDVESKAYFLPVIPDRHRRNIINPTRDHEAQRKSYRLTTYVDHP
jgi:hypothetical protein